MSEHTALEAEKWRHRTLLDSDGDKIGTVADVYFEATTEQPEWVLVHTGFFGTRQTIVPIVRAQMRGEDVTVPYEKSFVKDAPNIDADQELSPDEELKLSEYYGLTYTSDSTQPRDDGTVADAGGDASMTRSEEELAVSTARRPSQLVRLRKHIVTENKTVTVPVQHEELRIEREPITDAAAGEANPGAPLSEDAQDMTLSEEQVVVEKKIVPKERVRIGKDVVTEQQEVSQDVRREQIDIERETSNRS
jgi:uncharacterized protein (TIGR02271 family)